MQLEEETKMETQAVRQNNQVFNAYFEWAELDDFDEDREILLNEFKQDLNALNTNPKDLEEGMLEQ